MNITQSMLEAIVFNEVERRTIDGESPEEIAKALTPPGAVRSQTKNTVVAMQQRIAQHPK